jgi:hypothetical protein
MKKHLVYVLGAFLLASPAFASTGDIADRTFDLSTSVNNSNSYTSFNADTSGTIGSIAVPLYTWSGVDGQVYFAVRDSSDGTNVCSQAYNYTADNAGVFTDGFVFDTSDGQTVQTFDLSPFDCQVESGHSYEVQMESTLEGGSGDAFWADSTDSSVTGS